MTQNGYKSLFTVLWWLMTQVRRLSIHINKNKIACGSKPYSSYGKILVQQTMSFWALEGQGVALFRLPFGGELARGLEAKGPPYFHLPQQYKNTYTNSPSLFGQSDFLMELSVSPANSLQHGLEEDTWCGLWVLVVKCALLVRSTELYHTFQCTKHWFNLYSNSWDRHMDLHFNPEIYRKVITCPTSHIN